MKNFRQWLEQLTDDETEVLSRYGYQYLDQIKTNDMTMVLLEAPYFPPKFRYHLAFHRVDRSSFNVNHQFSRDEDKRERRKTGNKGIGMVDGFKALEPLMDKLKEWIGKYKKLVVASTNPELTKKWIANLTMAARYMNMPISVHEDNFSGQTLYIVS